MNASLKLSLSAMIALALATPALAQDSRKPTSSGTSTGGSATPRGGSSAGSGSSGSSSTSGGSNNGGSTASSGDSRGPSQSRPVREPQTSVRRPSGQAAGAGPDIPAYSRPRNGAAVRGTVVDRGNNPLPIRGGYSGYYYGYPGYYDYYGSPRRFAYYPVYTGFGHFYYDPFWGFYGPSYNYGYGYSGGYSNRDDRGDRHYGIGSLRLKIDPRQGEVYVDGLYRGVVDDFDGVFQRLKLEAGAHRLEVRAAGFRTLVFDVLVTPGETTTYRGDLKRQ